MLCGGLLLGSDGSFTAWGFSDLIAFVHRQVAQAGISTSQLFWREKKVFFSH